MQKTLATFAALAALGLAALPGPAAADERRPDGFRSNDQVDVSAAKRKVRRHYYARRYYGGPYYDGPFYDPYYYGPRYYGPGPGIYIGPRGFGFGFW
jgi:hypothetical protein